MLHKQGICNESNGTLKKKMCLNINRKCGNAEMQACDTRDTIVSIKSQKLR